jgi:hypothetical protein
LSSRFIRVASTVHGDVAVFENRQAGIADKFITKISLFIQLLGVILRLELKPISEQNVEHILVARQIAKPRLLSVCILRLLS